MCRVLIYGAGSIGNHLAFACRSKDWIVTVVDNDTSALERTRETTYPQRYGKWDENIRLIHSSEVPEVSDIVVIGTPPDTHEEIAIDVLSHGSPTILLIEKPFGTPSFLANGHFLDLVNRSKSKVLVGYNHNLTANTRRTIEIIDEGSLGEIVSLNVRWQEHWGGIFNAHPWLNGPSETYLGYWDRGGGACGEHSHGINLWHQFAELLGFGKVTDVSATMDMCDHSEGSYDQAVYLHLHTEGGLIGSVIQDVVTYPPQKCMRIQGSKGYIEWIAGYDDKHDAVIHQVANRQKVVDLIARNRPDDFVGEINHVEELLGNRTKHSPISLENGLQTMKIISAAYSSYQQKKVIQVNE